MSDFKNMNNDYRLRRTQVVAPQVESTPSKNQNGSVSGPSFGDVLDRIKSNESVKFSKHAMERLNSRQIEISDQDLSRLTSGIARAKSKGVRDALIMMDNKVFVASVQNKTIITAAVDDQLKDSVFTNIDGAVIV